MFPTFNLITELEMNDYIVEKYGSRHKTYPLFGNTIPSQWHVYRRGEINKLFVASILKYGLFQKPEMRIFTYKLTDAEKKRLRDIADPFVKKIIEA